MEIAADGISLVLELGQPLNKSLTPAPAAASPWPAVPHSASARFCIQRLTDVAQELFAQLTKLLSDAGELSLEQTFIEETKLEANANRYSFVWKNLYAQKGEEPFVQGKGKRKTPLQKAIEIIEEYLARQKKYDDYNHSFGKRNSFSKTDRDAAFMRMKEDHMRNGQLKPGRNVTLAVDAEYIPGAMASQMRNDTDTLIPMLGKLLPLG